MDRSFEPKLSWNSLRDDIIKDFYKPALRNCKLYQRLSAYFSSTTFANIAEEILDFIEAGGRIQLITSSQLSARDKELFEKSIGGRDSIVSDTFLQELKKDPSNIGMEFSKIMAYMLTNMIDGKPHLEIKIAIPKGKSGIYHQKIGIMRYENEDRIAFLGSINETGMGWRENIENFSVYRSWGDDTSRQGVVDSQSIFNDVWKNNDDHLLVFDLPDAVRKHLLEIRPESDRELKETIERIRRMIGDAGQTVRPSTPEMAQQIKLRDYQEEAIKRWMKNGCRGLLEMATGTGKTFTAFGCASKIQKMHERTIIVIASPQKHLVEQWKSAIRQWNYGAGIGQKIDLRAVVTCDSDYPNWRNEIGRIVRNFTVRPLGYDKYITNHVVIFTTHNTLQDEFLMEKILESQNAKKCIIIDEVHNITETSSKALMKEFDFRLGLSATPVRHLDEEGTDILNSYFHDIVYTLNLDDAIHKLGVLCQYDYLPYYVELTEDEMVEHQRLTAIIARIESSKKKGTYIQQPHESSPYLRRADLIANAESKYKKLGDILNELGNTLDKTLVYCTNNPSPLSSHDVARQLARVQAILTERGITSDSVTWKDKTADRIHILDLMNEGHFDCVTAVKCLDEGVDVPSVNTGIFMASSGNPRQFIQRRGRILRKSDKTGKTHAVIYDILVTPLIPNEDAQFNLSQRKMIARELLRHKEFALIARNRDQAITRIRRITDLFEIDFEALDYEYIQGMGG